MTTDTTDTVMTVLEAEDALKSAVRARRPAREVQRLQKQLREAKHAEADAAADAADLAQIERDAEQERQAAERLVLAKKADAAEQLARNSAKAVRVTIEYAGLRVVLHPCRLAEPVARQTAVNDAMKTIGLMARANEDLIAAARLAAAGKTVAHPPRPATELAAFIADDVRYSVRRGLASVEIGAAD